MGCGVSTYITAHDEAILDLKISRDHLLQIIRRYNSELERSSSILRQLVAAGRHVQARLVQRRNAIQIKMIDKSRCSLENVKVLIDEIESAEVSAKIIDSLRVGNQALTDIEKRCGSIEQIETLLLDTREAIETQQSIDEQISSIYDKHFPDDEELLAELDLMDMPSVPLAEPQLELNQRPEPVEITKVAMMAL